MIIAPAGTLLISVLLVILAGSLLGSVKAFATRGPIDNVAPVLVYTRPTSQRPRDIPIYQATRRTEHAGRRKGLLPIAIVFALAYVVSTSAFFAWQSAWPITTDLRHLAAAPHCSIAHALNLGNAAEGMPGYFYWHDPDENGIACEPSVQTAALAVTPVSRLSETPLIWPANPPQN